MISMIDDIILLNYIDSGCFAEIYLSKKRDSNTLLATKKISLKYISVEPLFKTHLDNEIKFLKEFNHNNIIKLYDVKVTQSDIYLIMEYCNGGSLKKALNRYKQKYYKPFTEDIVRFLMKQILSAVEYLHGKGIVHRDLKLENILLKNDYHNENDDLNNTIFSSQIKIIDFNISIRSDNFEKKINKKLNLNDEIGANVVDIIDEKFDIWHLGLLCYEMLTGDKLFNEDYNIKQLIAISIPQNISLAAQTFLLSMLQINKDKRLSASELLKHEFITKYTNKNANIIEIPNLLNNINEANNINEIAKVNEIPITRELLPLKEKFKTAKKPVNQKFQFTHNSPMDNIKKKTLFPQDPFRHSVILPHHHKISFSNDSNANEYSNSFRETKKVVKSRKTYTCNIKIIGKNIQRNQVKIIVDSCIKIFLQLNGKELTAKKSAIEIKRILGGNWLVFISNPENKDFDFCLSVGKQENYIAFVFCNKLFQVYRYN